MGNHLTLGVMLAAAFAVWRLTHLLVYEAGPGEVLARLRGVAALRALGCFYCTSVWAALPAALWLGQGAAEVLLLTLALSGAAIVLERTTQRAPPVPLWHEEPTPAATAFPPPANEESAHVLLRHQGPAR